MRLTSLLLVLGLLSVSSCGPEAVAKRRAGLAPYSSKAPGSFDLERPEREAQEAEESIAP
jgi:hypothetical protein